MNFLKPKSLLISKIILKSNIFIWQQNYIRKTNFTKNSSQKSLEKLILRFSKNFDAISNFNHPRTYSLRNNQHALEKPEKGAGNFAVNNFQELLLFCCFSFLLFFVWCVPDYSFKIFWQIWCVENSWDLRHQLFRAFFLLKIFETRTSFQLNRV